MNRRIRDIAALALVAVGVCTGCQQQIPVPPANVIVVQAESLPSDGADAAWSAAPEYVAQLIPQDLVEPRLMKPSTAQVRVRAITDGRELAVRLAWADAAQNDVPGPDGFCDACAIQLPSRTEAIVPAPQMGETGRPVEITYWNAAWQAMVNGRGDTIQDIYPHANVDYYPFKSRPLESDADARHAMELRYAPARALHNAMAGPRQTPVQDLRAEGPGTITTAADSTSTGRGHYSADGWVVVIRRRLPAGVSTSTGTQIAFAVWEGGQGEAGARKMRTGWIPLSLQ